MLVTVCLLMLLPYFTFVFRFLSPLSIIEKIKGSAYKYVQRARRNSSADVKHRVMEAIDELQDVARSATEQSDRSIAMACVDALKQLLIDYQALRPQLPAAWFEVADSVADDPDFVSLAPSVLAEVEDQRLWFEVKIFRQYLSLMSHCVPDAREVANLIAINTGRVGVQEGAANRDTAGSLHTLLQQLSAHRHQCRGQPHFVLRHEPVLADVGSTDARGCGCVGARDRGALQVLRADGA